jgi:NAD(P)-dependent dehydrogenase (short-subunit alcohol dehydrogenase family)
MSSETNREARTVLIVGASRGLGHAMAAEFARRGWNVIGTVRAGSRTALHDLAERCPGQVEVETLDITDAAGIAALRERLAGRVVDVLFVNAGISSAETDLPAGEASTEEFVRVMVTNALSPMRVIEALQDLVPARGLIGAMSSGLGSVANNERGMWDVYRGSKAALNTFMRSFAARQPEPRRAMLVLAPGWIRTDMGGSQAPFGIEESAPLLVDVLVAKLGRPGLEYLDREGRTVPW